jgi:3-demethoxyubiquinol 3-hydroxylase
MTPSLPGDLSPAERRARMLRVNHAGEYGAKRIYAGQLAVLGRHPQIAHMAAQEQAHLDYFNRAVVAHGVRPTALFPLWHVAGFALGAATALMGEKAAMACTVAVEEVIDAHYGRQLEALDTSDGELHDAISRFRAEELEHRDTGLAHGAEDAAAYPALRQVIRAGSKAAIWLSERL